MESPPDPGQFHPLPVQPLPLAFGEEQRGRAGAGESGHSSRRKASAGCGVGEASSALSFCCLLDCPLLAITCSLSHLDAEGGVAWGGRVGRCFPLVHHQPTFPRAGVEGSSGFSWWGEKQAEEGGP